MHTNYKYLGWSITSPVGSSWRLFDLLKENSNKTIKSESPYWFLVKKAEYNLDGGQGFPIAIPGIDGHHLRMVILSDRHGGKESDQHSEIEFNLCFYVCLIGCSSCCCFCCCCCWDSAMQKETVQCRKRQCNAKTGSGLHCCQAKGSCSLLGLEWTTSQGSNLDMRRRKRGDTIAFYRIFPPSLPRATLHSKHCLQRPFSPWKKLDYQISFVVFLGKLSLKALGPIPVQN